MRLSSKIRGEGIFFLKYFGLFLLLFISVAMAALYVLLKERGNPFFYAKF